MGQDSNSSKTSTDIFLELLHRVTSQAVLVVIILVTGAYFFLKNETVLTPRTIAGFVLLGLAAFFIIISFFIIQLKEQYDYITKEYKSIISTLKANQRFQINQYQNMFNETAT